MASSLTENTDPNTEAASPKPFNKRVSISPKKPIVHSPRSNGRSTSRFTPADDDWSLDSSEDEAKTSSKKKSKQKKRRRRSSARFLRLSQGAEDEQEEDFATSEHLGEIYRQAIRMNAENKINAGNSWGLKLIENMDKFIEEVSESRCVCSLSVIPVGL